MMKYTFSIFFALTLIDVYSQNWKNFTSNSRIHRLETYEDGIYMSTEGGLVVFNTQNQDIIHYNRGNSNFPTNFISQSHHDVFGNLWTLNHLNGISKFDGVNWVNYSLSSSEFPLKVKYITSDNLGNLWLLPLEFSGIIKFDGTNIEFFNESNSMLPSLDFNKIIVDHFNNIWLFGGTNGLVKFDGINTTIYKTDNSNIPSNKISDLIFDNEGKLWMSFFDAGISSFDGLEFITFNSGNSNLNTDLVYSILFFNNEIWGIKSEDRNEIFKFDGSQFVDIDELNENLLNFKFNAITFSGNNVVWLLEDTGLKSDLISFNIENNEMIFYNPSNSALLGNIVTDIEITSEGKVWIADFNNLISKGQLVSYEHPNWEKFDEGFQVSWVQNINDSLLFFGSNKGIGKKLNDSIYYYNTDNSPLESNYVKCASFDKQNNIIWFGTDHGLYGLSENVWSVYNTSNSNLDYNSIRDICVDTNSNVWIITENSNYISLFNGSFFESIPSFSSLNPSYSNKSIELDKMGNIWLGTFDYGLFKLENENWINFIPEGTNESRYHIFTFSFDNQNDLWVSTPMGVSYFKNLEWETFDLNNSSLSSMDVMCFEFDVYNNVWMGTNGGGISVYNSNEVVLNSDENLLLERLHAYPNPINDYLIIELDTEINQNIFKLFDQNGKIVLTKIIDNHKTTLDTNLLEIGMYFYILETKDGFVKTGKLIKR